MANDNAVSAVKSLRRVLQLIRTSTSDSIPVQLVQTFLVVCENEGLNVTDLADRVGATKGTMSRHLLDLSERLRSGEEGYGLLIRRVDPNNLKQVTYSLSNKGKTLRNQIAEMMED